MYPFPRVRLDVDAHQIPSPFAPKEIPHGAHGVPVNYVWIIIIISTWLNMLDNTAANSRQTETRLAYR
jgi:hypothetical protein